MSPTLCTVSAERLCPVAAALFKLRGARDCELGCALARARLCRLKPQTDGAGRESTSTVGYGGMRVGGRGGRGLGGAFYIYQRVDREYFRY